MSITIGSGNTSWWMSSVSGRTKGSGTSDNNGIFGNYGNNPPTANGQLNEEQRRLMSELKYDSQNQDSTPRYLSIADQGISYSQSIRNQRISKKNTELALKKVRYSYKSISSQILRAKTSTSAKQVVSKAKREVVKLKRQKLCGEYDSDELEAAINHAKAMERVAKKKVNHLIQEELAQAKNGFGIAHEQYLVEYDDVDDTENPIDMQDLNDDILNSLKQMMDDTFLDELKDVMMSKAYVEVDSDDYKMMKLKHRLKEMRDIAKADSEYLKAIFKHYQEEKTSATKGAVSVPSGSTIVGMSAGTVPPISVPVGGVIDVAGSTGGVGGINIMV